MLLFEFQESVSPCTQWSFSSPAVARGLHGFGGWAPLERFKNKKLPPAMSVFLATWGLPRTQHGTRDKRFWGQSRGFLWS